MRLICSPLEMHSCLGSDSSIAHCYLRSASHQYAAATSLDQSSDTSLPRGQFEGRSIVPASVVLRTVPYQILISWRKSRAFSTAVVDKNNIFVQTRQLLLGRSLRIAQMWLWIQCVFSELEILGYQGVQFQSRLPIRTCAWFCFFSSDTVPPKILIQIERQVFYP